jgi:hypothetical protein
MSRPITVLSIGVIVAVLIGGPALVLTRSAAAMSAADKAARKHATATCRAQVKQQANYKEMSWYARHKAVRACVKDALAKQQH